MLTHSPLRLKPPTIWAKSGSPRQVCKLCRRLAKQSARCSPQRHLPSKPYLRRNPFMHLPSKSQIYGNPFLHIPSGGRKTARYLLQKQRVYAMRAEIMADMAMRLNSTEHMKAFAINAARGYICIGSKKDISRVARNYGLEQMDMARAAARAVKTCVGIGEILRAGEIMRTYRLAARLKMGLLEDELLELCGGIQAKMGMLLLRLKLLSKRAAASQQKGPFRTGAPHNG